MPVPIHHSIWPEGPILKQNTLPRTLSTASATFIIVGYVVGATIFILPGKLSASAGPAIFLAYLIAAVPAALAGLLMAQIGVMYAVSGACITLIRDALSPYAAFLYLLIMAALASVVVPLIAIGFADYASFFIPGLHTLSTAIGIISLFIVANLIGVSVASFVQSAMVIFFVSTLLVFGIGGVHSGDVLLLSPLFPNGFHAVALAAATAYFSYAGIMVVAEVSGEIMNPARAIPRAVLISFLIIVALYAIVPLALNMTLPWQDLGDEKMAVVSAAATILPFGVVRVVALAALVAAATSINGLILGISRDVYQGAEIGILPRMFSRLTETSRSPAAAVILVGGLSIAGTFYGAGITGYAQVSLIGLMIIQIITAVALMLAPTKLPEIFSRASFQLGRTTLKVTCSLFIAISSGFLVLLSFEQPRALAIGAVYLGVGSIFYFIFKRRTK